MEQLRNLIETGLLPEKDERDLLKNFKSACPPEARNVAAFRVISNSLHVTEEVVRERMFALTVESDLCLEDKRLLRSYDSILNFQIMEPSERAEFVGDHSQPKDADMQSGTFRERKIMNLGEHGERKMSITRHVPHDTRHKKSPVPLSVENSPVNSTPNAHELKASILKNVFRRPSTTTRPRRSSMIELKPCFVKLLRMPESMKSRFIDHSRPTQVPPKEATRKEKPLADRQVSKHQILTEIDLMTQKPQSKLQLGISAQNWGDCLAKPGVVQKPERGNSPPPTSDDKRKELFVETIAEFKVGNPKGITTTTESKVTDTPNLKSPIPKIQEFSIFDCPTTPKKPHKRPLIYAEEYRRRLSSTTTDDEKPPPAVVNSPIPPPVPKSFNATSSPEIPPTMKISRFRDDDRNSNGKKRIGTLNMLNSHYKQKQVGNFWSVNRQQHFWRKSDEDSRNSLSQAKIVDAKQNGKFILENDSLATPLKNFRIPFQPPEGTERSSGGGATNSRRDSYYCHWNKFPEQRKNIQERFGNQFYSKGEKWYNEAEITPWRKLSKHDHQSYYPQHAPTTPPYKNPGYFTSKSPEHSQQSAGTDFFTFPESRKTVVPNLSSEQTTFNLISDAMNPDCTLSPTEIIYHPLHGVEFPVPNNGADNPKPQTAAGRVEVGTTLTTEVYFNHYPSFTTSMMVDEVGFYEVFSS